jgi:hypothetical protein
MDNIERRVALAKARNHTMHWANLAEEKWLEGSDEVSHYVEFASMWASVADALKVGNDSADRA